MENCENLKKMSFKGLEKWLRNIYTDVSILRYLDLACLPLYIIRIPVNCQWVSNAFPGRFSKNWWWATKFWLGHVPLIDKKIKSFDSSSVLIASSANTFTNPGLMTVSPMIKLRKWRTGFQSIGDFSSLLWPQRDSGTQISLKMPPRTPGIRLFMLLLWESVGRRRHLMLERLWMAMNLNRNDIMTVWNKCFFFISQTIKISST